MKGFTKKMIWFFGFGLLELLNDLVYWVTHGTNIYDSFTTQGSLLVALLIMIGIHYIPLLYMKDDRK